ncbi:purine nucleoside phosphorylase LACC1 isoform X2 [Rhincodon typus]|uniref:purine nucleoside phosphorylase LACC1 isoform X2 n=1 Tax=Rhincodon typus TaxID=259920 RepID=UPI00202E2E1B|nr:purine nucleoside phosphorylase LACC1 isoform X2 [Rhincodon typus]
MVEVVLIDFSDVHYDYIEKWLHSAVNIISTCNLTESSYVFMTYSQDNTDIVNNDIQKYLHQLSNQVEMPKANLEVLVQASFAAILYTVKQKIDKQSLSNIQVIVSTGRKAAFEVYVQQLFTATYKFTFETLVIGSEGEIKLQLPGTCVLMSQQRDDIWKDIWMFMAQLKGVMGEIVILKSLLIPDTQERQNDKAQKIMTRTPTIDLSCSQPSAQILTLHSSLMVALWQDARVNIMATMVSILD